MCGLFHQGQWCSQRMQKTLAFQKMQNFSNVNNSKQSWREFEVVNSRKWIWYFFPCESTKHSWFYIQLHISRMFCNFNICANTKMFQSFRRHACIKDWSRLLFTVFSFDTIRDEKLTQCQIRSLQIINTFHGLVNTQSRAYTSAITVTITCPSKTTRKFC